MAAELLWLDVLHKATACLRPTVYTTNRRAFDVALQTVGFWAYLDQHHAGVEYGDTTADWIGARYVEFHAAGAELRPDTVAAYRRRIETEGWIHAASDRVLGTWQHEYGILGLGDPGLRRSVPLRPLVMPVAAGTFVADWEARVARGTRPAQVKDRVCEQDASAWQTLVTTAGSPPECVRNAR